MAKTSPAGLATDPPAALHDRWMALVVVLSTFLAYFPSLSGEFIWNDSDYVTAPALRSWEGLTRIWTQFGSTEQYYPILHSWFWGQWQLWGPAPAGYHLVTIFLHAGSALVFALILRRLAVPGAWLAALLFALHPVHVESVAWITEQKNTLSLLVYLLAAWCYLNFDDTRRPRTYAAALALFVLSLLCKTVTATLPAALLVILWWKRGRLDWRRDIVPLLPWLAAGAAMGLLTSWVEQNYLGAKGAHFALPLLERGLVAGRAIPFYLGQFVWPLHLNFVYERWTPDATEGWQWLYPAGVLVLAVALWRMRGWSRAPLAAFLLFTGSLFPVLGFVNLFGAAYSWVWDHWQYLPDLALCAFTGGGLAWGWRRLGAPRPWGSLAAAGLLGPLAFLTWNHCGLFHDDPTLFRTTLERNPTCWMAHNNLGILLAQIPGRMPEAMIHFEAARQLNPDYQQTHFNLGKALLEIPGRQAAAAASFRESLRCDPNYVPALNALGLLLAKAPASLPEALACLETAARLSPRDPLIRLNLADALANDPQRQSEAAAAYQAMLELQPDNASAHNGLGLLCARSPARLDEAKGHFTRAVQLKPDYAEAHNNLALTILKTGGSWDEAQAHLVTAVRLEPQYAEAHFNLGHLLSRLPGQMPAAIREFAQVVQLQPDNTTAHLRLGILLSRDPAQLAAAIGQFEAVIRLDAQSAEAHFNLGQLLLRPPERLDEALTHFEAALRINPDLEPARQMIARIKAAQ